MNIQDWFKESDKVYKGDNYNFVLENGFKITHYLEDNSYTIQDTRLNDFYTEVTEEDLKIIQKYGFINGTSIIMHSRNIKRVEKYVEEMTKIFNKKKLATKMLSKKLSAADRKFYTKQRRNCDALMHKHNDMLHFYKSKIKQFEPKFLNLTKTENNE